MTEILPDELVLVNTPKEMKEMVEHYLRYPEEKSGFISKAYSKVINNHTYFNRVEEMFTYLNMDQSAIIYNTFKDIKEKLHIKGV